MQEISLLFGRRSPPVLLLHPAAEMAYHPAEMSKNPHAVALGRLGNKARNQSLSPEQRSEIARKAVAAREAKRAKKKRSK